MSADAEIVRAALEDYFAGDIEALRDRLAADGTWVSPEPVTRDCHGREAVLKRLATCRRKEILTRVVDVRDGAGDRVLVRWFGERMERRFAVPGGIASIVVTVRGGRITRIQDCADHPDALAEAGLSA